MRKASYLIWLLIFLVGFYIAGLEFFPKSASQATSANMAYMGVAAALTIFLMIGLFPLVTLAYLLNWKDLFNQAGTVSAWRYFEAIMFVIPALLVGYLWVENTWAINQLITMLAAVSALPIILFGVVNVIQYWRSKEYKTLRRNVELAYFVVPALLMVAYLWVSFIKAG